MKVCIYPPCGKKRFSNGLCSGHFFRARERDELDAVIFGSRQDGWQIHGGLPDWFTAPGRREARIAKAKSDGLAEDVARVGKHGVSPEGLAAAHRVTEHIREGRPDNGTRMLEDAARVEASDHELKVTVLRTIDILKGLERAAQKRGWL